ncbi:DUF11 domain-containing protein [Streptomyces sp. TR1341]|uniref:RCC1 domain-containing protein n=1 Tax=Streptomyces sp. TR1341 TaxID=2601266 RepID=UPI00138ADD28|nr:DUF11 domain-containing protein [Streptomyces sp. TR1341]
MTVSSYPVGFRLGAHARAALTSVLVAVLCLTGLAALPASAQPSPPTDLALAWGLNDAGQLGDGTTTNRTLPVEVHLPADTQLTAFAAADDHSLALTSDGRVLAWGQGSYGQLGDGTATSSTTPVAVHLPEGVTVTAIAAGLYYSLALTSDGRVLAWGYNTSGQLGDGSTATWRYTPVPVHLPESVTAIGAGQATSYAVTSDGRVLAWGWNGYGQVGDGTTTNRNIPVAVHLPEGVAITAVDSRDATALALTSDGRVLAWGLNSSGQVGDGTTTSPRTTPVPVHLPEGVTVTAIASGWVSSYALTSDGRVLAWGGNQEGELGNGTFTSSTTPVQVDLPEGVTITAIDSGLRHALALTADGHVLAWGQNSYGQLGDGTTTNRNTPVEVHLPQFVTVTGIAAGGRHSLALAERETTTTTLTASPTTAAPGQPVTLTAHVTCTAGTPTGEVEFRSGTTVLGTAPLNDAGTATLTTTSLPLGAHQITAHYLGSADCPPSDSEPVVVVIEETPEPSLALTKQVESTGPFQVGDTVDYAYTVTNTGNTDLHTVTVNDDLVTSVTCDTTTLAPGDSTTCHGSHIITVADITPCQPANDGCALTNLAQATAFEPSGLEVASEQATATITVQQQQPTAELTLAKRVVSQGPFRVGDQVRYTYTITNTGNTTLHNVSVTDNLVTAVTCETTTLAPGESTTCHGAYTITKADLTSCKKTAKGGDYGYGAGKGVCCQVTNTAHATGTDPDGNQVTSNQATATIQVTAGKHDDCCKKPSGGYGYGKAKTSVKS